ncbi:MAG: type IV secretion system DNA-binding domain-containing protein [Candidatus Vogelbacteria bacterium]|nr:type IV secretion system DNA-binding domain-containing protein [Candidatus Vogelbacteria bacterium]
MSSNPHINYFAQTDFRGKKIPFGIKSEDRARHMYIIGKTGMGKSTLLENLAIQDIKNGEGLAFIDPHGKSAELLLDYIPLERKKDVIYFAPFDLDNPIAFNIMEDVGKDQRHLVANGLMATFKTIWADVWSARMEYILNNTILALLEYPGSTLLGVNRMFSDKEYRQKVVDNIQDPSVKSFWVDEFANYTERFAQEATPAIQNKVGQFSSNPLIRNIIGQPKSTIDFRKAMDEKKIFIINLSKGLVGEDNARLLGGMLVSKLYLAAMSRANVHELELRKLPSFYLYVDEFQSFANESFADILSEARKYKLALTIAHQYVEQMPEEVQSAVFGNVGTTICFRVGPLDAETFEKIFFPTFTKEDLVNMGRFQMYLTLMIDGVGSQPFSAMALPPIPALLNSNKQELIDWSRQNYSKPRAEVEARIITWIEEARVAASQAPKTNNNSYGNQKKVGGGRSDDRPKAVTGSTNKPTAPLKQEPKPTPKEVTYEGVPVFKSQPETVKEVPAKHFSLDQLKNKKREDKPKSTGASKAELRSALQELLGDNKSDIKIEEIKNGIKPTPEKTETDQIKKSDPVKPLVPEIPEDVLRQMLAVDSQ